MEDVDVREELFSRLSMRNWPIMGLKSSQLTLEDIFLKITRDNAYMTEEDYKEYEEYNFENEIEEHEPMQEELDKLYEDTVGDVTFEQKSANSTDEEQDNEENKEDGGSL